MTTIKHFETPHFEISIVELPSGYYRICYTKNNETVLSEQVNDYLLASFMFDIKLQELEGQ